MAAGNEGSPPVPVSCRGCGTDAGVVERLLELALAVKRVCNEHSSEVSRVRQA